MPLWTACLSALLTPTIAVLGAYIAYRQWRLSQNKLKLDLFDRRFAVYDAARKLLASILTSGKADDKEVFEFMVATREAKWLLSEEVAKYLEEQFYRNAIALQTLDAERTGFGVGDERTKSVRKQSEIRQRFADQYKVLDEHFSPYLKLGH